MTFNCLYKCGSGSPSTHAYHIYPESASAFSLIFKEGVVCDKCNQYFSKLEKHFIDRHPAAIERLTHIKKTKKGKEPKFESRVGFAARTDKDGVHEFFFPLSSLEYKILENGDILFTGKINRHPFDSVKISRLLTKMAYESLYAFQEDWKTNPFDKCYDDFREYARFGRRKLPFIWFAWKNVSEVQKIPQLIKVVENHKCIATFCRLSLPGVAYLIPFPPIPTPSNLLSSLSGWKVVDNAGMIDNTPGQVELTLNKINK